jgi:hypothetical protein
VTARAIAHRDRHEESAGDKPYQPCGGDRDQGPAEPGYLSQARLPSQVRPTLSVRTFCAGFDRATSTSCREAG